MKKLRKLTKPQKVRVYKLALKMFLERNVETTQPWLCHWMCDALTELYPDYADQFIRCTIPSGYVNSSQSMIYTEMHRILHFPEFDSFGNNNGTYWWHRREVKLRHEALILLSQSKSKGE